MKTQKVKFEDRIFATNDEPNPGGVRVFVFDAKNDPKVSHLLGAFGAAVTKVYSLIDDANLFCMTGGGFSPSVSKESVSQADGCLLIVDGPLHDQEKAAVSGMMSRNAALVFGPRAAGAFTWHLKAEANSMGRIFEVADTTAAYPKLVESALRAVRRRYAARWSEAIEERNRLRHPTNPVNSPAKDQLAALPGIIDATKDLRSDRGRLDAEKIRTLFGLSRAEMARLTKIQEETIRRTPDSAALQLHLKVLERCARLRAFNRDPEIFAVWLNTENQELEDKTPIELIREGRADVVADLVQDIITNRAG